MKSKKPPKTPRPKTDAELWAEARQHDLFSREMLFSYRNLGFAKPLGSFAFHGHDPDELKALGLGEKFRAKMMKIGLVDVPPLAPETHGISWSSFQHSKFLYLWDVEAVAALMKAYEPVLIAAGWPFLIGELPAEKHASAKELVYAQREQKAIPLTPLFDFVSDLYGDKTNAGRTDVCPGLSRKEMFMAFRKLAGVDDPSGHMYFDLAHLPYS